MQPAPAWTIRLRWPLSLVIAATAGVAQADAPVDFTRDVRPILSNHCFECHGPDAGQRQARLRLDLAEDATRPTESGAVAIVPGNAAESELVRRITSTDSNAAMPPPEAGTALTEAQQQLLRRWIDEGATYSLHWSFVAPQRPRLPDVSRGDWARGGIDRFVLSRLEQEELEPSPEADRETLVRRLSLDLIGLPPAIDEVERFVSDAEPDAYERVVDRLLGSPHYGEKMAEQWLDLARFGDTNGYQDDAYRSMWPYRDYVIAAFNANKPFDRFTLESLAGDLLPGAGIEEKVASGFNRNHRFNEEGGADPDEFLVAYAVDRANTTATVWLGLTLGCAQCHDHKYDPISQREYYQFYAFFNNLQGEVGVSKSASPPILKAPSPAAQARLEQLGRRIAELEQAVAAGAPPSENQTADDELAQLRQERSDLEGTLPSTLIMEEAAERRPAYVLARGDFRQPGETVEPGVPAILPPLADGEPGNRLGLARWLVDPRHPLTARVAVNRIWKQFFGTGLVATMDDFGSRGELPSHPELLDWLACEFIDGGWDTKALQKQIVMSATYRQASIVSARLAPHDPYNRLLSRQNRFRLSAEEIRDHALAVSGLLDRRLGGESVYPYQPEAYFADKSQDWSWPAPSADRIYRRGLYTFWRRTTPYPSFAAFDAPSRELCTVNRPRTNTPLQALVTLNDPVFVEAARVLAQRIMAEGGQSLEQKLSYAFRAAVARRPTAQEQEVLERMYHSHLARYRSEPQLAAALVANGLAPRPPELDGTELAAWTAMGNVLLNLDEALTRE